MFYIYESCSSLSSNSTKKTRVIQTTKLDFTNLPETIFKDESGNCWRYVGTSDNSYFPSDDVFFINFSGNYFTNSVNIVYPSCDDCNLNIVSSCTITYFSATKCDDSTIVNVKVCNVGPSVGITKLLPTVGQVCGIKNPSGDDFCVTLNTVITDVETSYEIITPAWKDYSCDTCPKYKVYKVNSCDGFITDYYIYDNYNSTTIEPLTVVSIDTDDNCYIISSYEGIQVEYKYELNVSPKIIKTYSSCNSCNPLQ